MKIKAVNIAQVVAGMLLIVFSLMADFFVPGSPQHSIGLIQKAGATAGLFTAVLGVIPSVESVTPYLSAVRLRITVYILVVVMLILLILPQPFNMTNTRILNLSHIPIFIFLSMNHLFCITYSSAVAH